MNSLFLKNILGNIINAINRFSCRPALCINEEHYTYSQFGQCISKIRYKLTKTHYLNTKVGLVINDDLETYASIIALWLEGDCYVPLHPNWPLKRCLDICEQVEFDLILDSSETTRYENMQVINTSELEYKDDCLEPNENVPDDNLAYILFTSGSTGKPKGVMMMRKNVAAFMDSFWKTGIKITEEDRCLQCFDLSFDVSVQGYLIPFTRGACCYTVPNGQIKYIYVSGLIENHRLTFGTMTPSMLRYLKPYFDEIDATSLKTCILTSEACPLNLVEEWCKYATKTEFYNFYGPTECTIYCTYYKVTKGDNKTLNGIISIGKLMTNCVGLILDETGMECAVGEKGELCIAGDQVTKGYWKNEGKNASSFFNRETNGVNMRFYRTGDLCYKDADGDIMYLGRLDYQAKIQGFRVEMGEIEWHAREFLGDKDVVCMAFENQNGLTEIAMFIESTQFDPDEMIAYMRTKMPSYMIPTHLFFIPVFPLNANDKIDKIRLKSMIQNNP